MRGKIGIYYTHFECFGHTSRVAQFASLCRKHLSPKDVFFVQGGLDQPDSRLGDLGTVYSLSHPFYSRSNFRVAACAEAQAFLCRSQELLQIVLRENPKMFFTEYFPLGRIESRAELWPMLKFFVRKKTLLFSIAGYPLLIAPQGVWWDFIFSVYKRFFIFSPPQEKDYIAEFYLSERSRRQYIDFFVKHAQQIVFAGYLTPEGSTHAPAVKSSFFKKKRSIHVAVVRGGGAYYPQIIAAAIKASDLLSVDYEFVLVAGPSTTQSEWQLFQGLLQKKVIKNARLIRWTDRYDQLMAESDVCVCPSSYHTSLNVMKFLKPAVLIPFEGYDGLQSFYEQPARARLLADHVRSVILPFKKLTAKNLVVALQQALKKDMQGVHLPKEWFGSGTQVFQELAQY